MDLMSIMMMLEDKIVIEDPRSKRFVDSLKLVKEDKYTYRNNLNLVEVVTLLGFRDDGEDEWRDILKDRNKFLMSMSHLYGEGMPWTGFFRTLNRDRVLGIIDVTVEFRKYDLMVDQCREILVDVPKKKVLDPLGLFGVPDDSVSWRDQPDEYFKMVDRKKLVKAYVAYIRRGERGEKLGLIYGDARSHYDAFHSRLFTILKLVRQFDESVVIHAPGDGIGVVAIACLIAKRQCVSSEPGGVGDLARKIGLITYKLTMEEHVEKFPDEHYLLSNLSKFVDLKDLSARIVATIYDVQMTRYPGYCKIDAQCMLQSNDVKFLGSKNLIDRQRLRDFSRIVGLGEGRDDRSRWFAAIHNDRVKEQGTLDGENTEIVKLAYTSSDALEGDFLVKERRFNTDPPRGKGQYQLKDGMINKYDSSPHRYYFANGFATRADKPFANVRELNSRFDIGVAEVFIVVLGFDPKQVRYAYSRGYKVPVDPVNIHVRLKCNSKSGNKHEYSKLEYVVTFARIRRKEVIRRDETFESSGVDWVLKI